MCRYFKPLFLLFLLLPAVASAVADLDGLRALITSGKYEQALHLAEAEVKAGDRDTALRFYYAYAAAQVGQTDKAIEEFRRLATELPKAPEPRNNLAALYAQQGKFDEARRELEAALATHQSYSTAHRNLGEIYSAMAAEAYNRALARGEQRSPPAPRLSLLNSMEMPAATQMAATPQSAAPAQKAEPPPPAVASKAAPAPAAMKASAPAAAPSTPAAAPAPPAQAAAVIAANKSEAPKPGAVASPAPSTPPVAEKKIAEPKVAAQASAAPPSAAVEAPAPAPATKPEAPEARIEQVALAPANVVRKPGLEQQARAVTEAVHAWARAWAGQNPNAYLSAYASGFQPEGGASKAEWSKQRRERLTRPKRVEVKLVDMQVKLLDDNTAQARFLQHYSSDIMEDTVEKRLELVQEAGEWKIQREQIGQRQY